MQIQTEMIVTVNGQQKTFIVDLIFGLYYTNFVVIIDELAVKKKEKKNRMQGKYKLKFYSVDCNLFFHLNRDCLFVVHPSFDCCNCGVV